MSPEKQLRAFISDLQEFSLLSQSIVVVLHVSPIHLFLGADTIDILLDIGISVTSAILVGIARVVRIQAVGNLPLIRHTVAICIYIRLHLLIFRESTNLADVCDDTQLIGFLVQTAVLKTAIFSLRLVSQSPEVAVWILLRQFLYIVSLPASLSSMYREILY